MNVVVRILQILLNAFGVGKKDLTLNKPLRYLIGIDNPKGTLDTITEVSYDSSKPTIGQSIAYCNLFDEKNSGTYGPYLHNSDTASEYNEGQVDPAGPGWTRNLRDQFTNRRRQGFEFIELDNPDSYKWPAVRDAIQMASEYGLKVIAKNAALCDNPVSYLSHPNIYGLIVEQGAGNFIKNDNLRKQAGKPSLPMWFVSFPKNKPEYSLPTEFPCQ